MRGSPGDDGVEYVLLHVFGDEQIRVRRVFEHAQRHREEEMKQVRIGVQYAIIQRERRSPHRNYANRRANGGNTCGILEEIAQNLEQIVAVEIMLHGLIHYAAGIGREGVFANDDRRIVDSVCENGKNSRARGFIENTSKR